MLKFFLLKGIPVNVDQTVSSKLSMLHDKNYIHSYITCITIY
uniref:Uncharacterized protein n=1 Tax=Anguilla anguilla TaxID=7936 RepID=A0A0E9Y0N4_ANGAN